MDAERRRLLRHCPVSYKTAVLWKSTQTLGLLTDSVTESSLWIAELTSIRWPLLLLTVFGYLWSLLLLTVFGYLLYKNLVNPEETRRRDEISDGHRTMEDMLKEDAERTAEQWRDCHHYKPCAAWYLLNKEGE